MNDKEKKHKDRYKEIERREEIREIDHKTDHPDHQEITLEHENFAPGENVYLPSKEDPQ